jgi:hypothetical protein
MLSRCPRPKTRPGLRLGPCRRMRTPVSVTPALRVSAPALLVSAPSVQVRWPRTGLRSRSPSVPSLRRAGPSPTSPRSSRRLTRSPPTMPAGRRSAMSLLRSRPSLSPRPLRRTPSQQLLSLWLLSLWLTSRRSRFRRQPTLATAETTPLRWRTRSATRCPRRSMSLVHPRSTVSRPCSPTPPRSPPPQVQVQLRQALQLAVLQWQRARTAQARPTRWPMARRRAGRTR